MINTWNNSHLSLAGRAELIWSSIQGVECFWLQCLLLPAGVKDRIHSLLRRILWETKFCPVAWKTVCMPKNEGAWALETWQHGIKPSCLKSFGTSNQKRTLYGLSGSIRNSSERGTSCLFQAKQVTLLYLGTYSALETLY